MCTIVTSRWLLVSILGTLGIVNAFAASCPVVTTSTGTAVALTEAPEGGPEIFTCTLPAGIAPPVIPTAVALTENPNQVPPVLSDIVVFTPTGLITFYSDPNIPTDITINETQTEAAHNFVTLNGTNYILTSDLTPEPPEVPEPATASLLLIAAGGFAFWRRFSARKLKH